MRTRWFVLALIVIVTAVTGLLSWSFIHLTKHDFILGLTGFALAVTTFFGVIAIFHTNKRVLPSNESIRNAITCSLVILYIYMVCLTGFTNWPSQMGALTQSFTTNFTTVVGVVIAFYFGASAVLQIFEKGKQK